MEEKEIVNEIVNEVVEPEKNVPKKRGRKPKQKTDVVEEQVGQRKRGRKKKFQIESIKKLRDSDDEDEKIVIISNDSQEEELPNQVQVSFGSLSITVNNTTSIDKNELRKIFDNDFNMKSNEKTPSILLQQDKGENNISFSSSEKKQQYRFKFLNDDEEKKEFTEKKEIKEEEIVEVRKTNKELKEVKKVKKVHKILKEFYNPLESKEWPTSTDILCWWCCHPFDCEPVPCPFNYDESKDIFETRGVFCSWECSGAYSVENHKSLLYVYQLMNRLYEFENENGLIEFDFMIAPNKICLKAFGGFMTIEEFRKNRKDIKISTDYISYTNQDILEVFNETKIKKQKIDK